MIYCKNCGHAISENATACPNCGEPCENRLGKKDKVVFVLLAVFFGWFGVHRFYLGDIGLGILYLLFSWTFIPYFVSLIEAIVIGVRNNDPRF